MGNDIAAVTLCETLAIAHARDILRRKKVLQVLPAIVKH